VASGTAAEPPPSPLRIADDGCIELDSDSDDAGKDGAAGAPPTITCRKAETRALALPRAMTVAQAAVNTLLPGQYMDDNAVDWALKHRAVRGVDTPTRRAVHMMSALFSQRMLFPQKFAHMMGQWTRSVQLFDKDAILVPVNDGTHWTLLVVGLPSALPQCAAAEVQRKRCTSRSDTDQQPVAPSCSRRPFLILMDSAPGIQNSYRVCMAARRWLADEFASTLPPDVVQADGEALYSACLSWDVFPQYMLPVPQQNNACDCGVFTVCFAEMVLRAVQGWTAETTTEQAVNAIHTRARAASSLTEDSGRVRSTLHTWLQDMCSQPAALLQHSVPWGHARARQLPAQAAAADGSERSGQDAASAPARSAESTVGHTLHWSLQ